MQEAQARLKNRGVEVLGISPDPVSAQKELSDKLKLNFFLLSDPGHSVAETYGVWSRYTGIIRSSFLIDEGGVILSAHYKVCLRHCPQHGTGCARNCIRWLSGIDSSGRNVG